MHSATAANSYAHGAGDYLPYTSNPPARYDNPPWDSTPAGNNDPRSIPRMPSTMGTRKPSKSKAANDHPAAYTTSQPERYSIRSSTPSIKSEYPRASAQYNYYDEDADADAYGAQTQDDWYHPRSPRNDGKTSSRGSPNYAYSKPSMHRQSIGHQEYAYPDAYEPRQRGHFANPLPWTPEATIPTDASAAAAQKAAQKAVCELFPELTGADPEPDTTLTTGYPDSPDYYPSATGYYDTRRYSQPPDSRRRPSVISPRAITTPSGAPAPESTGYPLILSSVTTADSIAGPVDIYNTYNHYDFDTDHSDTDDETTMSSIPIKQHSSTPTPSPAAAQQHQRTSGTPTTPRRRLPPTEAYDETDHLLVHYRSQGVSYKAIKQRLNLDEAESTLRGRYRTLTKPKSERLRKPVWSEIDVQLLLQAVDPDLSHVKWKMVSDKIVSEGGSYRFGSSTCKKQYLQLVDEGRAQPLAEMGGAGAGSVKRRKAGRATRAGA